MPYIRLCFPNCCLAFAPPPHPLLRLLLLLRGWKFQQMRGWDFSFSENSISIVLLCCNGRNLPPPLSTLNFFCQTCDVYLSLIVIEYVVFPTYRVELCVLGNCMGRGGGSLRAFWSFVLLFFLRNGNTIFFFSTCDCIG